MSDDHAAMASERLPRWLVAKSLERFSPLLIRFQRKESLNGNELFSFRSQVSVRCVIFAARRGILATILGFPQYRTQCKKEQDRERERERENYSVIKAPPAALARKQISTA